MIRVALQFAENLYLKWIKIGHFDLISSIFGSRYAKMSVGGR
ncbi:hypothetical protein SC1_01029 [Sphingopyxis sp. C-1]|nr:hypothetical protein SC1_01029 [Sphingopyxis sp. C-1]